MSEQEEIDAAETNELRRFFLLWGRPAIAAAVVGLLTFFTVYIPHEKERLKLRQATEELQRKFDDRSRRVLELEKERAAAGERIRLIRSASLELIPLQPSAREDASAGRLLWDGDERRGVLVVRDLEPAGEGRTYQLWLTTKSDREIPSLVFDTDESGRIDRTFETGEETPEVVGALVTDEASGGAEQPTGPPRLAGKVARPSR